MSSHQTEEKPLIRLVDDDPDHLLSMELLLGGEGWETASYLNAHDFLTQDRPSRIGCLILDARMPEVSGPELQLELNRREYPVPVIFLTGHGDVDMAVQALKTGAKDFLQKPVQPDRLLTAVARAVQDDLDRRAYPIDENFWRIHYELLTDREKEILRGVTQGLLNKQIARQCGISERTVQAHRRAIYTKLDVHNVADLAPLTVLFERGILK